MSQSITPAKVLGSALGATLAVMGQASTRIAEQNFSSGRAVH